MSAFTYFSKKINIKPELNIPFDKCNLFGNSVRPFRKVSAGFLEGKTDGVGIKDSIRFVFIQATVDKSLLLRQQRFGS